MTHTYMFAATVAVTIALILLAISAIISLLGGWFFLARMYPDRPFLADRVFSSTSAYFGRVLGGYRMCVSLGVNSFRLRLSILPLFRALHAPIVVHGRKLPTAPAPASWDCAKLCVLILSDGPGPSIFMAFWGSMVMFVKAFYSFGRQARSRVNRAATVYTPTAWQFHVVGQGPRATEQNR